jgi:hypothetical protein
MATQVSQCTSEERTKFVTKDRICSQEPTTAERSTRYVHKSSIVEDRLHASQMDLENGMMVGGQEGSVKYLFDIGFQLALQS